MMPSVEAASLAREAAWKSALLFEAEQFQAFIALLKDEQQQLVSGSTDGLIALASRKTELAQKLMQKVELRRSLQPAPGVPLGCADPQCSGLWEHALHLAQVADHLNRINGELIQTKLRLNQQALAVLFGAGQPSGTYSASGQTSLGSSRKLGSG